MNTDDPVGRALEQLRVSDASRRMSDRVTQGVFAAFDPHFRRRRRGGVMAVAVAVAATFAAAISYRLVIAPPAIVDEPRAMSPATEAAASPTNERDTPNIFRTSAPVRDANIQTVYARVPRSYLPLLGIPVIEPEAGGTVGIEVVVGEDGQRQAIRVVQ